MYASAINTNNQLEIYNATNEEYMPIVLTLTHVNNVDTRRTSTKTFDDADEMMTFIKSKQVTADNSYNVYFQTRAYEIINDHYIKLYYETIVSNA